MAKENPLEFVPTEALLKEIRARHDDIIMIAATNRTQALDDLIVIMKGPYHALLGLANLAQMVVESGELFDE
tara:strand:- start:3528 stop:3743 length:216 start_codon:yes stop_codon:yes gene_type:complete